MSLKERLNDDLRTAMRGGDDQRRNTIRLALSSNPERRNRGSKAV